MKYYKPVINIWVFLPNNRAMPIDSASDITNALSNQVR